MSLLTPTSWTPEFSFTVPGDLSVEYITQTGDYFQDPNTGLTLLRYNVTFTPTFTTASGYGVLSGHGLSRVAGAAPTYMGPALGSTGGPCQATFNATNKIAHGNVPHQFFGAAEMVSGQPYQMVGEIMLVTQLLT